MRKEEIYEKVYYSISKAIDLYSSDQLDSTEFASYLYGIFDLSDKLLKIDEDINALDK